MTDYSAIPHFKPVDQRWRIEYGRIRKLGDGDYWEGCKRENEAARARMSPYQLGAADHLALRATLAQSGRYRITCPFADRSREKAEYDLGWDDLPLRP